VLAAVLYRPWQHHPLPITDYSEFLPLLEVPGTAIERLGRVNAYFLAQGRANIGMYAYIVASWELFGKTPWLWDATRFGLMAVVLLSAVVVVRRFGIPPVSAAACSGLFVVASAASNAWTRLTGEPIAAMFLFPALGLATRYAESRLWLRDGLAIALLLVGVVLTKEALIVTLPAVLWTACCSNPAGIVVRWRATPRNVWLTGLVLTTSGACLVRAILAMAQGQAESYAATYGAGRPTISHAWLVVSRMVTPVSPEETRLAVALLFPANLLFAVLLVLGVVAWLDRGARSTTSRRDVLLSIMLVAGGTIAYAPWPRFEAFYAFPFLLALALFAGNAMTALASRGRLVRGLVALFWVAITAYCGSIAYGVASFAMALREVNAAAAVIVGRAPSSAQLLVATSGVPAHPWEGVGATLRRYALATGFSEPLPTVRDIECANLEAIGERLGPGQGLLVYRFQCGSLENPDTTLRAEFRYLNYGRWNWITEEVCVDVKRPRL